MKAKTGGEAAAKALIDLGVEYVFTLTGGHLNHIHMHLEHSPVQLIDTRHEQGATFMADAYGRMTGKPGVAMLTAGPGFTNALTPMMHAMFCNTPLLIIAGAAGMEYRDKLDLQDAPQVACAIPMVKKAFVCTRPERAAEYVEMAYRTAYSGRPGPVFLELPCDVLGAAIPDEEATYFKTEPLSAPVDRNAALKAAKMLLQAQKPIIIAGSGAGYAKAGPDIQKLMETTGAPLFTCNMGRGIVSDEHPLCFGHAHPSRNGAGTNAYLNADLFLILGHRISLVEAFGGLLNKNADIIQVDVEPEEIGRNRHIALPVFSDAGAFVRELNEILEKEEVSPERTMPWITYINKERAAFIEKQMPNMTSGAQPIHPQRLVYEVDKYMSGEDDIIIADGGDTHTWVQLGRTVRKPYRLLDHGLFGCIGGGICNTVTARLLYPESRLALVTGDGSLGFNFMEINTAIRHNMHFVIVVCNDQSWGMIRHSQQLRFGRPFDFVAWLGFTPYHEIVKAMGGEGFLVTNPDDLPATLDKAFASKKVALINVVADPEIISPASTSLANLGAYKIK
ncbi:MAG: thiamine pyrophosphate-binding protein [Desulfovibrionaceae bacterium]|nr:thiamine pyrophosphate-binding protein [Desulfovibrionaceae bacterium]